MDGLSSRLPVFLTRERHSRTGNSVVKIRRGKGYGNEESREQIVTATLSLSNLKFQIVCKILINEECIIVNKYNSYQPGWLLSSCIFLRRIYGHRREYKYWNQESGNLKRAVTALNPATCVIAKPYSSTTSISLHFHSHKKNSILSKKISLIVYIRNCVTWNHVSKGVSIL
jgi:hypothetical protein